MRRLLAFSLVSLLSAGCSISVVTDHSLQPTKNECKTNDDCGSGGVCSAGMCRAVEGKFSTVMFEITPPATSVGGFAGIRFLKTVKRLDTHGGQLDLSLDNLTTLTGTFNAQQADFQSTNSCPANEKTLPGTVTFTPSAGSLGWSSGTATVDTSLGPKGNLFALTLPPGKYDIYVQPTPSDPLNPSPCNVPPVLFRGRTLGGGNVGVQLTLPAPSWFSMTVQLPKGGMSLDGWTAQMIDSIYGVPLSDPVTIKAPENSSADPVIYDVDFAYSTVVDGDPKGIGHELILLSPPKGADAPSFYMDRSALQLMSNAKVEVGQLGQLSPPVTVKGTVEENNTLVPAEATVTLSAVSLDGLSKYTLPSYIKSEPTDKQGRFTAKLLPGTYRVQVVPNDPRLAAYDTKQYHTDWTVGVAPRVQAGKVIGLHQSAKLTGSVLTPSGQDPLVGAPVQAVPSPSASHTSVLEAALGGAPLVPRASSEVVDEHGLFTLRTDPGIFDVSVRPQDGTGFPWLVRSNVQVQSGREDLGQMKMPLPVVYTGQVSVVPQGSTSVTVPGALVRAYIFMDSQQAYTSDPDTATSVLPIAETRADNDGKFKLLLPAQLN